jgi:hypothetical protein
MNNGVPTKLWVARVLVICDEVPKSAIFGIPA